MNPIDALFQRLRQQQRPAFMPFLPAGDPDLETTVRVARSLAANGANLLEIGFPYSDPIADGPVIQASFTRALDRGFRLDALFDALTNLRKSPPFQDGTVPLVAMCSYALVHRRGPDEFLQRATAAGLSGAILPDLPIEEAEEISKLAAARDFKIIHLISPMTPRDRAVRIAQLSTGFIYYISVTGITGTRDQLPEQLLTELAWLRQQTKLPICVGFGISKPEHVRLLKPVCDGVIVGSALVRLLEQVGKRGAAAEQELAGLARSLADAIQ